MISLFSSLLLLFVASNGSGVVNAASWDPIDPRQFPHAQPSDTILVQYVTAPLLKAEVGPIFKWFDLYHGGLAFTHVEQNFTFVANFDSVDLSLFSSQVPVIHKLPNGTTSLQWFSEGALYCYAGLYPNFWTVRSLGRVNGTVYSTYLQQYLIPFNGTWPYYEMFNVEDGRNGTLYLRSRECFDFVMHSLAFMNRLGANLHGTLKRNLIYWTSSGAPTLVDAAVPATWRSIVEFYETLELHWGSIDSLGELLKLLGLLLSGDLFYLHVANQYYAFKLEWPVLDIRWRAVAF